MSARWQPIATLPDFPDCPDMILVWNGCNGPELLWMTAEVKLPHQIRDGGCWELWRTCPEPSPALKAKHHHHGSKQFVSEE